MYVCGLRVCLCVCVCVCVCVCERQRERERERERESYTKREIEGADMCDFKMTKNVSEIVSVYTCV